MQPVFQTNQAAPPSRSRDTFWRSLAAPVPVAD